MRREGLRSQVNNMKNNEYKKLENNEELEKISLFINMKISNIKQAFLYRF